ncbi:hypothetical protein PGH07_09950 [Sulfurovum sp. zt1-1]|uniref:SGNH hydrolase-type esterase domain-containing protein n=1 Tax=Sulfurovum zhangzhouensis TaxID=3019067 RepID=A0ABT7R083_9BACT|nr:hypothetical protein [Sulfurovum zhangzhouensis]MDM5272501.1 hypothetical protein [Sulfurovum zhangzhouensis]
MQNKQFIRIVIFLPILFFIGFESFIYFTQKEVNLVDDVIKARNSEVHCLIMGDSHTEHAFRNEIKSCQNLSVGGASIPMIIDAVYSVDKKNKLKTVILVLEPHDFSEYRILSYSPTFKNISEKFTPIYQPLFNIPFIREVVINHFKSIFKPNTNKEEKLWTNKSLEKRVKALNNRVKVHIPIQDFEKSEYSKNYQNLITYLVNKKINVYLVRTPVVTEYEKRLFDHVTYDRWNKYIEVFRSLGAKYIDYKDLNFDSNKEFLFKDQDHLNSEGAKIFSQSFKKYILEKN